MAKLLKEAKVIILDEAPMARRQPIESFDFLLQDIVGSEELFGAKIVVFGGDFRQLLPVIPRGSDEDIVSNCLLVSHIWPKVFKKKKSKLTENMQAIEDPMFTEYFLRIWNGKEHTNINENIYLPEQMVLPFKNKE